MRIDKIDKDMGSTSINKEDVKFYDARKTPFKLYGFYMPDSKEQFKRMPEAVSKSVNDYVEVLNCCTSGGRVRFKTDSEYVTIKAFIKLPSLIPQIAALGSLGFDIYADGKFAGAYRPKFHYSGEENETVTVGDYEGIVEFHGRKMRDIIINFPLLSGVCDLHVGLQKLAQLECGDEYKFTKPIVYYGSSITQGGSASRPGNSYPAMISRELDCDFINLGLSGSGKGEPELAEYISTLDMSCFVYDYDQNAEDAEHLRKTHKPMFDIIRKKQPDLPIIMMSSVFRASWTEEFAESRKQVILDTYNEAIANGDKNVYFIDGWKIFDGNASADGSHPNDHGFMCMAQSVLKVIEKIFDKG